MQDGIDEISEVIVSIFDFSSQLASNPEGLQEACGTNETTAIVSAAFAMQQQTCVWASTLVDFQDFMSCNNWHPLYSTLTYSAVCYDAAEGLYWIAISSFIMVTCAMIMLTLRVGFYNGETHQEVSSFRERWKNRLCCFRKKAVPGLAQGATKDVVEPSSDQDEGTQLNATN